MLLSATLLQHENNKPREGQKFVKEIIKTNELRRRSQVQGSPKTRERLLLSLSFSHCWVL